MVEVYIVKITNQAESQMKEITRYIAYELRSPDAARHLLHALENAIMSLNQFPQRVALADEEPWHGQGIHCLPVKNFLVYFWVNKENLTVQVTAVVYAKRDQVQQLSQMDIE